VSLHAVQFNFATPPPTHGRSELPWYPVAYVAEAVAQAGNRVTVVQSYREPFTLERGGVQYHFLRPFDAGFASLVERLEADVFHIHGLEFSREMQALHSIAPKVPFFVQDHANRPPRPWHRRRWRSGLGLADAFSFCARSQAQAFESRKLLPPQAEIFEISESSSDFGCGDQKAARAATGLAGDPCLLSVGNLNSRKDPLTVLEGVSLAARHLPGLQLWCAFTSAPLMNEVQRRIAADAALAGRVHLLGGIPHARIEQLMRAADLFVIGSHREGSGCALMEAMACGLPPVITDIPPHRALTGAGEFCRLWTPGQAQSLCDALLSITAQLAYALRAATRARFDSTVSFAAIGRQFTSAYEHVIEARRSNGA
jgi:glycosyltransferase involved in cell wall biosynthesis